MKKLIIILALLPLIGFSQFANYTTSNGLISDYTTCFTKAPNGDLWIGTTAGISKYSGGVYTGYDISNGLIHNTVVDIEIDNFGKVWVGTPIGISVFDGATWTNHSLGSSSANNVKDIEVAQNGDIWIATYAGIFVYNGFTFYNYTTADGLPINIILSLSESDNGTMWIGTAAGICRFNNPGFTIYNTSSGMSSNSANVILATNDTIYTYNSAGLDVFDGTNFTLYDNFLPHPLASINNIQKDSNGDILLGFNNGITKLHNLQIDDIISYSNTNLTTSLTKILFSDTTLYIGSVQNGYFFSNNIDSINANNDTLDINNIHASVYANGILFSNGTEYNNNLFEVPAGSDHNSNYASTIWLGGMDDDNSFHIAGGRYNGYSDWVTGPISNNYSTLEYNTKYNRVWKIDKSEIDNHIANWNTSGYIMPEVIENWPDIADYFDFNTNGIYDPENGDYPIIRGDQAILTIFNDDLGNSTANREKMLVEVHALNYAFNSTDSALNNTIFTNYKIINNSTNNYSSVFMGVYDDIDIGYLSDDYMGSDTILNSYYIYNGDNSDDVYGTGSIPAQSVTFLNTKMTSATYFTLNALPAVTQPTTPLDYYNYLMGNWRDGTIMTYGGTGYGGTIQTKYCFSGDPSVPTGWNENDAGNTPGDRVGVGIVGAFDLAAGQQICIDVAYVNAIKWGYTNLHSVKELKARISNIHYWYSTQSYVCDSIITFPQNTLNIYAEDTSFCADNTYGITLSSIRVGGTYPYTYEWADETGAFTSTIENPTISLPSSTTDYYVTITDDDGNTATDTLTFTVNPIPIFELGNDTSICNGESINISLPTYNYYHWNTGNNTDTIQITQTGTYSVTVYENECQASSDIAVNVITPEINFTEITPACIGETLQLSVNNYPTINWSTSETTPTININTSVVGQNYYYVSVTDANGCSNNDSTLVVVNNLPQVFLGNDTTIDENWSLILNAYVGGGGTYSWSDGSSSSNYIFDGSIGEGVYNVSVNVTDINGCSNNDDIEITVLIGLNVDENGVYHISIYPNPSEEKFNIKLPDNKEYNYKIIDINGQLINNGIFNSTLNKLSLKGINKGTYFLIIDELNINEKLIVK